MERLGGADRLLAPPNDAGMEPGCFAAIRPGLSKRELGTLGGSMGLPSIPLASNSPLATPSSPRPTAHAGVDGSSRMAQIATQNVEHNGLADVVTIVPGRVEELAGLPTPDGKADVLVSEWMGAQGLASCVGLGSAAHAALSMPIPARACRPRLLACCGGADPRPAWSASDMSPLNAPSSPSAGYALLFETMLDSVLAARDKFLKPGGAVLPDTATILVAGASAAALGLDFWDDVYGFSMLPVHRDLESSGEHPVGGGPVDAGSCEDQTMPVHSFFVGRGMRWWCVRGRPPGVASSWHGPSPLWFGPGSLLWRAVAPKPYRQAHGVHGALHGPGPARRPLARASPPSSRCSIPRGLGAGGEARSSGDGAMPCAEL